MKQSVRLDIKKKKKIPTVFHPPDVIRWHQERHNLPSTEVVPGSPRVLPFRPESKWFGTGVAFLLAKENLLILKEKNKTIKQDHYMLFGQRIITKHHFDEWSINKSGTCSFNFLPNTQVADLRKNALLDMCGAATLWKTLRVTEPRCALALLLSIGVGFLHLTPFPL